MSKPKPFSIKCKVIPANMNGGKDYWGREWIYCAEAKGESGTGDNYYAAIQMLLTKFPMGGLS